MPFIYLLLGVILGLAMAYPREIGKIGKCLTWRPTSDQLCKVMLVDIIVSIGCWFAALILKITIAPIFIFVLILIFLACMATGVILHFN